VKLTPDNSKVNEDCILAVQVFDQKKFKKKDQGFLGVINIRVGDVIELVAESDGMERSARPPAWSLALFRPS
jgi:hypothetical protein